MDADLAQPRGKGRQQRNQDLAARINEMYATGAVNEREDGTRVVIVEGFVWIAVSVVLWVIGALYLV